MLNRVTIMGRIGKDIELRQTQGGVSVTTFPIACDRDFKGQNGERETDWVQVVAWRNDAEFVARNFSKGRMIVVDGKLQARQFTDKNGNKQTSTEVVAEHFYFADNKPAAQNTRNDYEEIEEEDGDVPF